jgi:hypothetical protein
MIGFPGGNIADNGVMASTLQSPTEQRRRICHIEPLDAHWGAYRPPDIG